MKTYRPFIVGFICLLSWPFAADARAAASPETGARPNFLIVMVDDLGFSDIGCYGGEIETPVLDALAANGLRFSQFYNTAKCHSSRVSLLTGAYCRQAGDTALSRGVTTAEVLGKAGYFTMMTGKWHLKKQPTDFGFDRYFGHLSGACNYYLGDNTFRLNGEPWNVPAEGFYTTVANVDYAIRFLGEAREAKKPWYLYLAFNAPHAPLQPLKEDYEKYAGRYKVGWDVVRAQRLQKQKEIGLFGKDIKPSPRPDHVPAWDDLSKEWQVFEEKRMMALAGMIDRVDQELGRLVSDIKAAGELDNTLILFVSDNGSCPYDRARNQRTIDQLPYEPNIRWSDSTGLAWMRNSPFRFYKQNQYEGGIATPAVLHFPAGLKVKPGSINHEPAHLIDVMPTLAELAGAEIPQTWPGRDLSPVSGVSLAPALAGNALERKEPLHFLFNMDRALRDGDWKLVSFRSQRWELYNLADDRTELNDLASKHPERVRNMVTQWHDMGADLLQLGPRQLRPVDESAGEKVNREWSDYQGPVTAPTRPRTGGRQRG